MKYTFNQWILILISVLTLSVSHAPVFADDLGVVQEDLSATSASEVLAPTTDKEHSAANPYMAYNKNSLYPIPEAAIIFRTRLWREVYLKERKNKPFFSKNKEITRLIIDGVKEGKLTPYQDETLTETMTKEQFIINLQLPTEEVSSDQGFGEEEANWGNKKNTTPTQPATEQVADEFLPTEVTTLELMEDLLFDKRTSAFIHDIQTVKLIIPANKFPTGLRKTVGTFKYKDLVTYFNSRPKEAVWVNVQNDAGNKTFAEAIQLRLFDSRIVKRENPDDRTIEDIYNKNPKDHLYASQKMEEALIELKQFIWEP